MDRHRKLITNMGLLMIILALAGAGIGCPKTIVRDEVTYKTGIKFKLNLELALATSLETRLKAACTCKDGKFEDAQCKKDADNVLVAKARSKWHADMDLFNAGILKDRPSKTPPVIPAAETLCPAAPVAPTTQPDAAVAPDAGGAS